jgi:hypothetical protein
MVWMVGALRSLRVRVDISEQLGTNECSTSANSRSMKDSPRKCRRSIFREWKAFEHLIYLHRARERDPTADQIVGGK